MSFRKIFATKSFFVATVYYILVVQLRRKSKYLTKIKHKTTSNLYHAVQNVASDELAELQKLM